VARLLTDLYKTTRNPTYKAGYKHCVNKVMECILVSRYPSGGWPQAYPRRTGRSTRYSNHVTYNDDAMTRVMVVILDIPQKGKPFDSDIINEVHLQKLADALAKGVDFTLKAHKGLYSRVGESARQ